MRVRIRHPEKFQVIAKCCGQCPMVHEGIVSNVRRRQILSELAESGHPFVCHKTLGDGPRLVCRGFYEKHPNLVVHLARELGLVEFVELE